MVSSTGDTTEAARRAAAEVNVVRNAAGKKLAKGNYNIRWTKVVEWGSLTSIDMSFTVIDSDILITPTLYPDSTDPAFFSRFTWKTDSYMIRWGTGGNFGSNNISLKFIENSGIINVFYQHVVEGGDGLDVLNSFYMGAVRTSEEAAQPQDVAKAEEWLKKRVEEVLVVQAGNKLAKGDYDITWTLNNSHLFSNKISLIIDDPETINIKVNDSLGGSTTFRYNWVGSNQRYETPSDAYSGLLLGNYLKFIGNTGNLEVFAGTFVQGGADAQTANGTYTPVVNYNDFLTTSYTVDYVNEFVLLRPNGERETNINSNTTIIKKLFDNKGVVFTQSAWRQVRSHMFKI